MTIAGLASVQYRQLSLILAAVAVTGFGLAGFVLSSDRGAWLESEALRAGVIYGATLTAVWVSLSLGRYRGDPFLLPIAGFLGGIGLVMAVRLGPDLSTRRGLEVPIGERQLGFLCAGLLVLWAVALFSPDPAVFSRYRYSILALGVALLAVTAVVGTEIYGARLWLTIGPVQIQSAEIVKLALVVFLATYLADNLELVGSRWRVWRLSLPPIPYLAPMVVMWGLCIAALIRLNDLGTALLFFSLFIIMLFAANGSAVQLAAGFLAFLAAFGVAYQLVPRVGVRVDNWIDPWSDPFLSGYQQIQAEYAMASGGLFGVGIGAGAPWSIPAVQTDYVIAAIGEELGFWAVFAIVVAFAVLAARGMLVASEAPTPYLRLLAIGLTSSLVVQSVIIVAGVLRLMPLTGVTVPFVSYGGSSLLVTFAATGLLMHISHLSARRGRQGWAMDGGLVKP